MALDCHVVIPKGGRHKTELQPHPANNTRDPLNLKRMRDWDVRLFHHRQPRFRMAIRTSTRIEGHLFNKPHCCPSCQRLYQIEPLNQFFLSLLLWNALQLDCASCLF